MRSILLKKWVIILIAATVFLFLILISEYLFFLEHRHRKDQKKKEVLHQASMVRTCLENEINTTLNLTMGLVVFVSGYPDFSSEDFAHMAEKLVERTPHIRNIGLAKDNVITHVFPLEGNEAALGLRYMAVPEQKGAVLQAIRTGKTVIAGPVDLVQGGRGFVSRIPIFLDKNEERYWGLASVVVDIESLCEASGLTKKNAPIIYALRGKDGLGNEGEVFYGEAALFDSEESVLLPIILPAGRWILAATPRVGWKRCAFIPSVMRIVGSLSALLISLLIFALLGSYRRIRHLALHDPLTGLPNRRLLDQHLRQCIEVAKRGRKRFAVLYIDLDDFKPVNDRFGHKQGDRVLAAVARNLRACLRKSDIVARVGGDEFVLVLPEIRKTEDVSVVAEKIGKAICRPIRTDKGNGISVKASIGASIYPDNGTSFDSLIKHADSAMYAAKSRKNIPGKSD